MLQFVYNSLKDYQTALKIVKIIGIDHEAQPDEQTIVVDSEIYFDDKFANVFYQLEATAVDTNSY